MIDTPVWDTLNRDLFFVKDAVKRSEAKFSDKLDLYDPERQTVAMECREPNLGGLTKVARLFGGNHDRGTPFEFVVSLPGCAQQVIKVSRGSATLSFTGGAVELADHQQQVIGSLRKKVMTFGNKFQFTEHATKDGFLLETKMAFLGGKVDITLAGQNVATLFGKWKGAHADFFKSNKFQYAFYIAPEVEKNSRLRQVLLAYAVAQHRINV